MSDINIGQAGMAVQLRAAILLYGQSNQSFAYGTVHPVLEASGKGNKGSVRPVIGAGVPLDRAALIACLQSLAQNAVAAAEFLPPTVLAVGPHALTWWCPPGQRRVFFDCKEIGKRSAVVPHPGIVFHATHDDLRLFALKGGERPQPSTVLFEPPYFNTWDDGDLCIGSAKVPRKLDVASIPDWEAAFFESAFTHPNHGKKRLTYKRGEFAFWKDMLDGNFGDKFPERVLVPMDYNLGDLIASNR